MFRLRKDKGDLMWHSVYSDTHRFSVGFKINPMFAYTVAKRYGDFTESEKGLVFEDIEATEDTGEIEAKEL